MGGPSENQQICRWSKIANPSKRPFKKPKSGPCLISSRLWSQFYVATSGTKSDVARETFQWGWMGTTLGTDLKCWIEFWSFFRKVYHQRYMQHFMNLVGCCFAPQPPTTATRPCLCIRMIRAWWLQILTRLRRECWWVDGSIQIIYSWSDHRLWMISQKQILFNKIHTSYMYHIIEQEYYLHNLCKVTFLG